MQVSNEVFGFGFWLLLSHDSFQFLTLLAFVTKAHYPVPTVFASRSLPEVNVSRGMVCLLNEKVCEVVFVVW